ncbi:hypothetical protein OROHE_014778 [Orobanche hederae]
MGEVTTILKKRMQRARKRSRGVPMANIGHSFSEDLIMEILSWLPVKTLLQFRAVCKSWSAILKSPHFVSKHLKNYYSNNGDCRGSLIVTYEITQAGELNVFEFLVHDETKRLLAYEEIETPEYNSFICGPCDGIFYLWCFDRGDGGRHLWNPALNECKTLPPLIKNPNLPSHVTFVEYNEAYGFGYDPCARDYKVIIIKGYTDTIRKEFYHLESIFIYSLRDDGWRYWGDLKRRYRWVHHNKCYVFVNGCLYWLASDDWHNQTGRIKYNVMIAFDLATDEFREWQVPDYEKPPAADECLVVCCNSVALLFSYPKKGCFVIWTFNGGSSWTKKYTVNFDSSKDLYHAPVGHWRDNKVLIQEYGRLAVYDLDTQQTWYLDSPNGVYACENVSVYRESLVSVSDRKMWA